MDSDSSNDGSKSHKLLWIIGGVVILLLIGGVIAYFINKHNEPEPKPAASTSTQSTTTPTFAPATNSNQPYSATITSTLSGAPKSATLISDGQGNYSYTYQANGQTVTTVYTADAYYICNGSATCIKYPATNTTASTFDPTAYQYDTTKLESLKSTAAYKGQVTCPGGTGTCDKWSITSTSGKTTTTLYIDSTSKRILKATTSNGTTESGVIYEYKDVHIAVPTSSTTAP